MTERKIALSIEEAAEKAASYETAKGSIRLKP